ncbi:MAG: DUF4314 domain-containing protein [Succinivibrionaceae bacterium]|nr:DUF4314 domain-containing protein [Succinivibrionaceae bacterium]
MQFPNKRELETLRERFPAGTRIRLNHMDDPYAPVPPGTTGSVVYVDDAGNVHMKWDNGRSLSLIPDEDDFTIIKEEENT